MNVIKLTTAELFVAALLLSGLMIIQAQAAPTLSVAGKIAFASDRDGNSEIYLMNADGTGQTRLTNSPFKEDFPTWSPDGRRIAFLRQSGDVFSINLMNADGTNETELTRITFSNAFPSAELFSMSWSPNGAKIAFQDSTDIFTINVDRSNRVNLTGGQFINYAPTWSSDGSRIAFARSLYSHGYYPHIFVMDADGGNSRQITNCIGYCAEYRPAWSPDGERIAFSLIGDSESIPDSLSLVNPDGTNLKHNSYGLAPKWSPDGAKIVFYRTLYPDRVSQIWMMNRDGTEEKQLTITSPNNLHPDWQPLTPELGLIVTRSDDRNNPICVPGDCSLREAVNSANASPTDDSINFASGLTTITLTNEIVISGAGTLAINGPGANVLTIDGGTGTNRIFYTNNAAVTISGVTLTGGNGTGAIGSDNGGAILAYGGSLTLDRVHVTGNSAGKGGGVGYSGGTHRIINSTISANNGSNGGGIYTSGSLTVINSTVSTNTADNGGGIYDEEGSAITLRNVTITNNRGSGIFANLAAISFGNSIVAGNINTVSPGFANEFNCYCRITSAGGNLVGDSPGDSTNTGISSISYQTTDIRDRDPLLGGLQNNGGSTPTHALLAGSPVIDKGLNILVSPIIPAFDQRGTGFVRIRDGAGAGNGTPTVDIGAFEVQLGAPGVRPSQFDFDGDGRADLSVFRPSNGAWYLNRSVFGFGAVQFGSSTDKLTPADYDGDGKTDIAIFRSGVWAIRKSSNGQNIFTTFGQDGDIPVAGDYDGDGRADIAVFRLSNSVWYILRSSDGVTDFRIFGDGADKPVPADYDGDGKTDIAVFRASSTAAVWYWQRSQDREITAAVFGSSTDKPVPADYDGDGKADIAIFRSGSWAIRKSSDNTNSFISLGQSEDIPVPADYDGDGKADAAVFRNGAWYLMQSSSGFAAVQFGQANDKPVPAAFLP